MSDLQPTNAPEHKSHKLSSFLTNSVLKISNLVFRKNSIMSNTTNTETPTSNNTVPGNTTTNFDLSKIDPNVKAYINAACQVSSNAIISTIKSYIDQTTATQMDMINKLNDQLVSCLNKQNISNQQSSILNQQNISNHWPSIMNQNNQNTE
ncbi:3569_t:CDS:2 [Scutellospora calospora]|uniref:3569_t:CDS:1 n=1 Tax=Scutellospora calospora TaxID=85575 RepID=A0ACA9LP94_9GLOM|nr:3569_t:CDS:2 [Scutellospora calospora]